MPVLFSVLPYKLKSRVTEIRLNPAKRNLFRPRSDILPDPRVVGYRPRLSCDGFGNPAQLVCPEAKLLRLVGEVARRAGGVSHAQEWLPRGIYNPTQLSIRIFNPKKVFPLFLHVLVPATCKPLRACGRKCRILAARSRTIRMPVACLAIVRQECRTSYQFLLNAHIHAARSIKSPLNFYCSGKAWNRFPLFYCAPKYARVGIWT